MRSDYWKSLKLALGSIFTSQMEPILMFFYVFSKTDASDLVVAKVGLAKNDPDSSGDFVA